MLYTLTTNPTPINANLFEIAPGHLYAFPFEVKSDGFVDIIGVHMGLVQDHSVRFWVSSSPGGESISHTSPASAFWHPNRTPTEIVRVQDENTPPTSAVTILVSPGVYFMNALNLINSINLFTLTLTQSWQDVITGP